MSAVVLPKNYVEVLAVAVLSGIQLAQLGYRAGGARHRAGLEYPYAYADKEQVARNPEMHIFNCYQRVHQNTLEMYPSFITFLLVAGLTLPRMSACVGAAYLISREAYAQGYYTGDPEKRAMGRNPGSLLYIALLGMSFWSMYSICMY